MKIKTNQKSFEKIIVDADKFLLIAAKAVQEDYVEITNLKTGKTLEYSGVQAFWGKTKALSGEALKWSEFWGVDVDKENDLEVKHCSRLRSDISNHLEEALKQFSYSVGAIKKVEGCGDYVLCIGGEGNFRYDVAKILPYKGLRLEKPIVFQDLKDEVFKQYKNKLDISNGYESDDKLGMYAAENQKYYVKNKKFKYLLAYEDKDLKQLWGPWINIGKLEDGVSWINPLEACHHFCYQMLKGDKAVDNILGIHDLAPATRSKLNLRKTKGCGEVAANAVLEGCSTIPELLKAIVDEYKAYYTDVTTFVSDADGKTYHYNWKDYFLENARLLWMLRKDDVHWDIFRDLLDPMKIEY